MAHNGCGQKFQRKLHDREKDGKHIHSNDGLKENSAWLRSGATKQGKQTSPLPKGVLHYLQARGLELTSPLPAHKARMLLRWCDSSTGQAMIPI